MRRSGNKKVQKNPHHTFLSHAITPGKVSFSCPCDFFFLIQKFLTSNISSTSSTSLCNTRLDTNCPLGFSGCHQHFSSQIKIRTSAASFSVEHLLRFSEFDLTFHASLKLFFSERFHPQGTWFSKKKAFHTFGNGYFHEEIQEKHSDAHDANGFARLV